MIHHTTTLVASNGGYVIINMGNPASPTLASERARWSGWLDRLQVRAVSVVDIYGIPRYALVASNENSISMLWIYLILAILM